MAAALAISTGAQEQTIDLTKASLEDLMNIAVTSVSKKEEKLSRTASAIFVITAQDIQRSNATNIPDLLRMVPGLDVAQINANTWAISARGFNSRFSNKLLVLLDGRSAYTPTFDGVFWDVLDLPLEDIERIEVIRGPGASVWASNAVNGVINIITKKASDTSGVLADVGGGTVDQGFGTVQYGGIVGNNTSFRAFAKYLNEEHFRNSAGQDGGDGWGLSRIGFRTDTTLSSSDTLTFEGDLYRGREGNPGFAIASITSTPTSIDRQADLGGGFIQGVWNHTFSDRSDTSLQLDYDRYARDDVLGETRGTLDLAFQDRFAWGDRQSFVWGVEYRYSESRTAGSLSLSLNPPNLDTQLFSAFVQDEIALVPDRLFVTVGTKLEHNYFTGFDAQPSVRIAWTPNPRRTLWAAVSKADRDPAETDNSVRAYAGEFTGTNGTPVVLRIVGNPDLLDETAIAYEAGYRASLTERFGVDLTAFYSQLGQQKTTEPGAPFFEATPAPPHLVLPLTFENLMHGESHGFEIAANWKVASRWTLSPGYAFEQIHMHLDPTSQDTTSVPQAEGASPVHSAQLRSHLALSHGLSWDASAYFVDRLTDPAIPAYTRFDTGLTWQWNKKSSLSFVGQNLLKDRHEEFVDSTGSSGTTLIKRSAYVEWTWQF